MMEKVIFKYANSPIVFVAPHGHKGDDLNTDLIAIAAAEAINANYLINKGYQRADFINVDKDIADCNNINHMQDILVDEFLLPYKRLCKRAVKYYGKCLVLWVHGISNTIRNSAETKNLDLIIGYGQGKPNSFTCYHGTINKFLYEMKNEKLNCFVGKTGGKYSGYSKRNMNQYWRKVEADNRIQSLQIEIVKDLRSDKIISELTAQCIADAAQASLDFPNFTLPEYIKIKYA